MKSIVYLLAGPVLLSILSIGYSEKYEFRSDRLMFLANGPSFQTKHIDRQIGYARDSISYLWKEQKLEDAIHSDHEHIFRYLADRTLFSTTIFYCNEIISNSGKKAATRHLRWHASPVEKLPFDLDCAKDRAEIAIALNLDSDDFPHIWLILCQGENCKQVLAADDNNNSYAPEVKDRLRP